MSDGRVEKQVIAAAIRRRDMLARRHAYDAYKPESRPTETQQQILSDIHNVLCRYVVAGNQSGKTQLGARECAWIFDDNHPTFNSKEAWGDRPLTMIVLGRTTKQMQEELWERKIKPHLDPQNYHEAKSAGVLQSVKHKVNGNTIIFISHNNVNEARQNAQAFVAHWVWLDEMPNSVSLFAELEMRTVANRGRFLATFTPLIKNLEIKNKIETSSLPTGKKYQFGMLDNPIYAGREEDIIAQFSSLPEGERNARLHGEWFFGERTVYNFEPEAHIADPVNYSPSWRHMEVVDPAASSDSGYTLWAECPNTKVWFLIKAKYIAGMAATDLIRSFQQESHGVNIIKRRSDPHEVFFIKEANKQRIYYEGVYAKTAGMKMDLIKNVQEMLNMGRIKISNWAGEDIIEEFVSCQWSDNKVDTIQFKSRFHILDAVQYFCYDIPTPIDIQEPLSWEAQLRISHKLRREKANKPVENALRYGKWKARIDKRSI